MMTLSYYYWQTWVSSTLMNHYPSPSTGARKVIGLSFPRGGEGGNEDYYPLVCCCCCSYFALRDMTNNCHSKRAGVVATASGRDGSRSAVLLLLIVGIGMIGNAGGVDSTSKCCDGAPPKKRDLILVAFQRRWRQIFASPLYAMMR
jgi:hypothetical protein